MKPLSVTTKTKSTLSESVSLTLIISATERWQRSAEEHLLLLLTSAMEATISLC